MIKTALRNPKYAHILEEIGKHLRERKDLLLKRSLLIIWPIFIFFAYAVTLSELMRYYPSIVVIPLFEYGYFAPIFLPLWIIGIFSVLYIYILRSIFFVEKLVWIDSHFDGRGLEPRSSWKIAKKLFWPSLKFRIYLLVKYYLSSYLLLLLGLILFSLIAGIISFRVLVYVLMIESVLALVAVFVGLYYLRVKLRYAWFIFLDTYGNHVTYKEIIHRMNLLNRMNNSDSFRQALIINFGEDTIKSAINAAVRMVSVGIERAGSFVVGLGRFLGLSAQAYGKEVSLHVTQFAKLVGIYVIFKTAKKAKGEQEQFINEKVYDLIK